MKKNRLLELNAGKALKIRREEMIDGTVNLKGAQCEGLSLGRKGWLIRYTDHEVQFVEVFLCLQSYFLIQVVFRFLTECFQRFSIVNDTDF
jgi:hypothetical protein